MIWKKKVEKFGIAFAILAIFLSTFLSVMATGCGGEAEKGDKRDELVVAIGGEPDAGFDPTTGWGRYGSPLFQSTLLTRDDDLRIVNDLATSYEVSADGKTWTVVIREDVKFSDGQPLTAEDVAYTYNAAAQSGSVVDLSVLEKAEAVDKKTVRFILKEPRSTFLYMLTTLGIVPKHAHGQDYAKNPVGSGPFRMVQWDKGQQLIVESNPHYYGKKPYFRRITFLFMDEDAAFAAAKAGEVDIVAVPHTYAKENVEGMKLLPVKSVDNRGICFPFVPSGGKTGDGNPVGNDVTSDPAIRKAVSMAVSRQKLVEGVLEGYGKLAYSICDNLPWWNPETVVEDGNVERAKAILEEAGWKDIDGDGIVEKGNLKASFTLVYPATDRTRQALALAVRDMVKPAGIEITVEGKSWDDIKKLMHSNAVLFGWGSHDPLEMYNIYHSKMGGVQWFNPGFYRNQKVDAYLDAALSALDERTAIENWKKAQWDGETGFSLKGDAPWVWLVNIDHCYFVKEGLDVGKQRIQPHGHGWPITANVVDWKWSE